MRKKTFIPALIVSFFFWINVFFILWKIPPSSFSFFYFFFSLFFALFFTSSLLLTRRRGFLISLGIIVFLILRLLKMAHFLNLFLLLGILISLELYLNKR